MSSRESKLLPFNNILWNVFRLGEHALLLECSTQISNEKIHDSTYAIEEELGEKLDDIVPSYHSITVFSSFRIEEFISLLQNKKRNQPKKSNKKEYLKLPICYELGYDIELISKKNQLSTKELIDLHLKGTYRAMFIGFTPGFVYASGLNTRLSCSRLENPRKMIPAGSVGIGKSQTGIYSLNSPGGWNIIGRTPIQLFDLKKKPPILINIGTYYQFQRITLEEFETWES